MSGIIWLASYPKSGNTWLRTFLHNLLLDPRQPADINSLDSFCFGDSQAYNFVPHTAKPVAELSDAEVMALRPKVQRGFALSSPDSVFVKTHNALQQFQSVPLVSMENTAAGVYVVRNPLDVCLSLADHAGITIDEAIALMAHPQGRTFTDADNVFEFYGAWSHHVETWTEQKNEGMIVVKYEDMAAKPRATFKRIANFLKLEPPRQRLDKAIKFSSFRTLARQEAKSGFRERSAHSQRFFRVGKAGQWKGKLSAQQVDAVVSAQQRQMARFGYLP